MNFDLVYEKYINGNATEEEKAYIEAEIAKAKKLSAIIDQMDAKRVIEPAEKEDVKKATRTMKKKFALRAVIISFAVLIALTLVSIGSVFAYVHIGASNRVKLTEEVCLDLAKKAVHDHGDTLSTDLVIVDWEKDLRYVNGKLSEAIYVYEVEVRKGTVEYEVEVDSTTGYAVIVDVDD